MAEFYADWGLGGMFISVLGFGALMGIAAWIIRTRVRPGLLVSPALLTVLLQLATFEQQFIKAFAGLIVAVLVTVAVLAVCRKPFTTFLRLKPDQDDDVEEELPRLARPLLT